MNIWLKSSIIALIATSVSYVVSHMMGWTDSLNWLEVSLETRSPIWDFKREGNK